MQALPPSIGPKKGRTELERTKDKLLGISQKHNDVVINNVSHRQKIRELEDELFNLRDECQGLRERNIALLARCQRQSQQQQVGRGVGSSGPENQVLLQLITTLLNATPALAQIRTKLEQAAATASPPEASTSAAAANPVPFQHWTPKLNPPGNIKASAEPVGIDGVLEEDEEDEESAQAGPSDAASRRAPVASTSSTSSLSSIASSSSSRSLSHQLLEETVVPRSQSRSLRADRRTSGLVPPPMLPPLPIAGQPTSLGLSRSDTLDNLPDMDDEWEEEPVRAEPSSGLSTRSGDEEVEQLIQHVPTWAMDTAQVTSPPLSSVADLSSTLARPLPQPSSATAGPTSSSRPPPKAAAAALKGPSATSSNRKPAGPPTPTVPHSAPPASRKLAVPVNTTTASSSSSRVSKTAPPPPPPARCDAAESSTMLVATQSSASLDSAGPIVQRRPTASTSATASSSKPRPTAGLSTSSGSTKPRPSASGSSATSAPLQNSTAGNIGSSLHTTVGSLPPNKGSLPGVKMRDVAEAMRAAVKASTPPPSSHMHSDPSTPMRTLSLEPPALSPSATSATTVDEDSQEVEAGRRLGRARKSVNYKEPSLNTKMRNPVATLPKKTKRSSAAAGSRVGFLTGDEDELSHSLLQTQDASNPALVVPTSGIVRRKSVLLKRGAAPPASDEAAVEYELTSDDDEYDGEGESALASEQEHAPVDDDQQATPRAMKIVTPAPRSSAAVERRRESGAALAGGATALPATVSSRRTSHRFSVGVGG